MLHLLITGGSGYLGAELVRQAAQTGLCRVSATYHCRQPLPSGAALLPLDLRDPDAPGRLLDALRPDLVIHTAYVQSGPDLEAITAAGAGAVAQAARRAGARLVHLSSDALLDGERPGRYPDDAPAQPLNPYGAAKAAAEELVARAHPEALIVRTSLIYGGAEPSPHERLVLEALEGRADVSFFSDEIRCPVQVTDLALALLELAAQPVQGLLNVAGADAVSRYEFACLIAASRGYGPHTLRASLSAGSGLRRPRNCALESAAAQGRLQTRLRGVREVLGVAQRAEEA